jgi:SAM-dependent methyltransferase
MEKKFTPELYEKEASIEFYQQRYTHGYMDDWPDDKKRKIRDIVLSLQLPAQGSALDLGCGNGVFTEVLKKALPAWDVCGADISAAAVSNANERYSDCRFFLAGSDELSGKKFDLIFTHHVLEHVYDLPLILDEMDQYLDDSCSILHVLPCGNANSYEHGICLLREHGIDPKFENRFFFEDEGHVRRLTTDDLCRLYAKKGFSLAREFYSNQHYGAMNWITQKGIEYILYLTDGKSAVDKKAARTLRLIRYKLLLIWALRYPTVILAHGGRSLKAKDVAKRLFGLILYPLAKSVDRYWNAKAEQEWLTGNRNKNGSEMFLYFKK